MAVRTIHLHGWIGEHSGPQFQMDVASPKEAVVALCTQIPGMIRHLRLKDWQVFIGDPETGRDLDESELMFLGGSRDIHFVPVAAGGKKKGGIGKIIAGVALVAFSIWGAGLASPLGGVMGFDATILGTSITLADVALFGVSMALSGLSSLLSPTPEFAGPAKPADENRSALFRGPTNTAEQGGPIALPFGRGVEVGSTVISAGIWTEQVEAPAEQSAGNSNAPAGSGGSGGADQDGNFQPDPDAGNADDGPGEGDGGGVGDPDGDGNPGGAKGGGKSGGGSSRVAKEAPNTLRSKATARVLDLIGEGEIGGLVDGPKSIRLDGTPLMSESGQYNFSGVKWDSRLGTPDQEPISGFAAVESETDVSHQVKKDIPGVITITDPLVDAVRVTLLLPALNKSNPKNGDMEEHEVSIAWEIQHSGGDWQRVITDDIGPDKCVAEYERSYRINLPAGGAPWDIRMVRLSDDTEESVYRDDTWFSRYTTIRDVKLSYPFCALMGWEVDAEQFGDQIPERTYIINGIKCRIPSNYDPETRTYETAVWDGTFAPETQRYATDNPGLIVMELLTNKRFGLGKVLKDFGLSKWDLYEVARYSDQFIPDGYGGTRPRFTFNGILNTREQAMRVIAFVISVARCLPYFAGGQMRFSQDRPTDPVMLVTNANVENGEFIYSSTSKKSRHTAAHVTWTDPEDGFKPTAIEVVEDIEAIHRYGRKVKEVMGWGINNRSQAHMLGKWIADTDSNQKALIEYVSGHDHGNVMPGDVIEVFDQKRIGHRFGGRIVSATANTVTLDAPVELQEGEFYSINVVMSDQELVTRAIADGPGTYTTLNVAEAFQGIPESPHIWTISVGSLAPSLWKVLGRKQQSDGKFQIMGVEYDPHKFARVEQGVHFEDDNVSLYTQGEIQAPTDPGFAEYIYSAQVSGYKSAVVLSWKLAKDTRVIRYEVMANAGAGWFPVEQTEKMSVEIRDTDDGEWKFRIRSLTALGQRSEWLNLTANLSAMATPPKDVENFTGSVQGDTIYLSWDKVPSPHLSHYVIRFIYDGAPIKWSSGNLLDGAIPKDQTNIALPALAGTYMIKAVSTRDVESDDFTQIFTNVPTLLNLNVVHEVTEGPLWSGVKTNLSVQDGQLFLAATDTLADWASLADVDSLYEGASGSVNTEGSYAGSEIVDLGQPGAVRVSTELEISGVVLGGGGDTESVEYLAYFEIAKTDDDPNAAPTWSDWEAIVAGDYFARGFKTRLMLKALDVNTRPVVEQAKVIFDVPDRVEKAQGAECPAAVHAINYSVPFKEIPVLTITAVNLESGDRLVMDGETKTGFSLHFENSSGVSVARIFNWTAQGYGYGG